MRTWRAERTAQLADMRVCQCCGQAATVFLCQDCSINDPNDPPRHAAAAR
jgi:hypothetical protein